MASVDQYLAAELSTAASASAAVAAGMSSMTTESINLLQQLELQRQNLSAISEEDELKMLNFPSKREDLSTAIPLTVIFALLLVTGCVGNLCTAIVIARPKNKYMHTATNYYLFSLAMSDFLFLTLGLPQEMYTLWQRYPYAFGESFCIIRGYLSEASTYASILTISAFTMERYVAICHPLWAHTMSQLPRAITSILIIWIVSAICAIPPAAELGIITQKGPLTNRTLEESAQCATKRTIYENMFAVSAIVFFIVPMIIVTVLYILIALELRRSSKMNAAISKQTSSGHHYNYLSNHLSNHHNHHNHHHHHHHHHHPHHHHHHHSHLNNNNNNHKHHINNSEQHQRQSQCCSTSNLFAAQRAHKRQASRANLCSLMHHQHHHHQLQVDGGSGAAGGAGGAGKQVPEKSSLMANIMSQRPSSAIGNEQQPQESATCSGKRARSPLWPPTALFGPPAACAGCCNPARPAAGLRLVASNSLQPSESGATAGGQQAAPTTAPLLRPETPDSLLCRAHSPLSYHESLLERPHLAGARGKHLMAAGQPHRHHAQLAQQRAANGSLVHHAPQHHQHSRRSAVASGKKSVIRMLVAVVVSFFICWLPFHAQRLMASYLVKDENRNQLLLDTYLKLTYISGVMYYLSSTINPLLYQLMSAKFRLAFKETFNCSLLKCAFFSRKRSNLNSPSNSLKEPKGAAAAAGYRGTTTCDCAACQQQSSATAEADYTGATTCSTWACSPAAFPPQQQLSAMARFRGRLHSSLVSLFRSSDANESATIAAADCPYCCPTAAVGGAQPVGCNPRAAHLASSCASTPLLMEPEVGAAQPAAGQFPAHSVLKFVRSATPLSPTPQQCLTRLSSREEAEEPAAAAAASCNDHQSTTDRDRDKRVCQDKPEVDSTRLGALIRPASYEQQQLDTSSDNPTHNLIIMTSDSSSSPSSSPEQQALVADGQPRPARDATSSSSESRLSVAGARERRRRQSAQLAPLNLTATSAAERRKSSTSQVSPPTKVGAGHNGKAAAGSQATSLNLRRQLSVQSSQSSSTDRQLDKKLSVSTTTSAIDCGSYTTTDSALMQPLSREHSTSNEDDNDDDDDELSSEPSTTVISCEPTETQQQHQQQLKVMVVVEQRRPPLNGAEAKGDLKDNSQQLKCR